MGAPMITGDQVGMARRLLGWSRIALSGRSGVSEVTIDKIEKDKLCAHAAREAPNIAAIQRALESAGVEFTLQQPGVRLVAESQEVGQISAGGDLHQRADRKLLGRRGRP